MVLSTFDSYAFAQDASAPLTPTEAPPTATDAPPGTSGDATKPLADPHESATEAADAPQAPLHPASKSTWPNVPLLITGVVVLGGSYAASAIVGASSDRDADKKLYYPVVGPWVDLDRRDCNAMPCSNKTLDKVLLIGDGVLQGAGALSVLLSLVVPQSTTQSWWLVGKRELQIAPTVGMSTLGVNAAGRF